MSNDHPFSVDGRELSDEERLRLIRELEEELRVESRPPPPTTATLTVTPAARRMLREMLQSERFASVLRAPEEWALLDEPSRTLRWQWLAEFKLALHNVESHLTRFKPDKDYVPRYLRAEREGEEL